MLKNWLVAYTKPRHERKSAELLRSKGVDVFLPLYKQLRVWSDRKKWVETPLFPGYLFVNVSENEHIKVLNTYGIVKFIYFNHKPSVVRNEVVSSLQQLISADFDSGIEIENSDLVLGEEVSVKRGPLKGFKGRLVNFKGKKKIALEIECMKKTVLVEIDIFDLN